MSETAATYRAARSPRLSADERRAAIVAASVDEFAAKGLAGASTDLIARRAGVSQPYVFQLFGTKKDLFIAVVRLCFERTPPRLRGRRQRDRARRDHRGRLQQRRSTRWAWPTCSSWRTGRSSSCSSRPMQLAATRTIQAIVRDEFARSTGSWPQASGAVERRDRPLLRRGACSSTSCAAVQLDRRADVVDPREARRQPD